MGIKLQQGVRGSFSNENTKILTTRYFCRDGLEIRIYLLYLPWTGSGK